MQKDLPSMVGNVEFNYDVDKKEFGMNTERKVDLFGQVDEQGTPVVSLSFELGRKEDDTVTITLEFEEFIQKMLRAMIFGENHSR